jgi:hypothetical protein
MLGNMRIEDLRKNINEWGASLQSTISGHIDPERAHREEDYFYISVLQAIAFGINDGAANPRGLAQEVLRLQNFDFPRWYA